MSPVQRSLPGVIMRGGTSKGVFLHEADLPPAGTLRDELLLRIMGSPDPMQIDGLGGSYSSTSKVVVVSRSQRDDVDVSYWFAQVAVDRASVDWSGNCGNLTTAVGPFAIDERLVAVREPLTVLRLRNENTGTIVTTKVAVENGMACVEGDCEVSGVPGSGSPVTTEYLDPAGRILGSVLPTGAALDSVVASSGDVPVSIVDVTHPYAFVHAPDVGIDLTTAKPSELNRSVEQLGVLEELRGMCSVAVGVAPSWKAAVETAPAIPRLVLVQRSSPGAAGDATDVRALAVSMGKAHHALPMTGALALGAAARIPGTLAFDIAGGTTSNEVTIGHPKGVVRVVVSVSGTAPDVDVHSVGVVRTARRLMHGTVLVPSM